MYNFKEIEKKWQYYWEQNKTFQTTNDTSKPKFYALDMFPYPSGAGLHVGHPEGYTANDIVSRYKHACGYNVLHPMGWDAFGLPAENYAIKTGTHPKITTAKNIATFKKQIQALGFSYDWDREIDTTNPKYYKWTQWIFAKMFEAGLAYEQDLPINFCPSCKTGLANEEVLNNGTCERCGASVEKKKIRQWVLAITKYADRLEKEVDDVDWPEGIKDMQKKWIGRSEGVTFSLPKLTEDTPTNETYKTIIWVDTVLQDSNHDKLDVYTTRIDTVHGMTYAVIAPDHPKIERWITKSESVACEAYILSSKSKSDLERTGSKEKTGVFTGSYVINPFNADIIPVYIGDYVLGSYGTGAVMAVPAHDERDFAFAQKMGLPCRKSVFSLEEFQQIKEISEQIANISIENTDRTDLRMELISKLDSISFVKECFTQDGMAVAVNLKNQPYISPFALVESSLARQQFAQHATLNHFGFSTVNYKLRDWLFSRQRYWGEPIPLIHLEMENVKKLPHIHDLKEATDPNLAYILKRNPCEGESMERVSCNCGHVRELVIGGKVFSKIYDGLYTKIVVDYRLPLELPDVEKFEPSPDGQSPLARVESFVNVKLAQNLVGKRETNTMPQWGGSCWYYLRFMDRENPLELVNNEVEKYWGSVDSYVGGAEHAVLHLLYARFWHKFLYDIGVVSTKEPFGRLRNQGLILAYAYQNKNGGLIANDLVKEENGRFIHIETGEELTQIVAKMSKSLKNVVNPDDVVSEYGADALRLYEMYMSDFKDSAPWDTKNIIGVSRFLDKVWNLFENGKVGEKDEESMKLLHKTIKKVGEDIENYKFNTAIASLMILVNYGHPEDAELAKEWKSSFAKLLHPFAPHIAEELWAMPGNSQSIFFAPWPKYDVAMTKDDVVVIGVQVLGKLRGELEIHVQENKEDIILRAKQVESVQRWLEGKEIVKEIYVPGKIVNIVVK